MTEQMNVCTDEDFNSTFEEMHVHDQLAIDDLTAIAVPIGKDSQGGILVHNMAFIPHILIAGYTGSGKTTFIETILAKMASAHSPQKVGYVICSSKASDYLVFKDIPHMIGPVLFDYPRFCRALQWANNETFKRLKAFSVSNVKDVEGYNKRNEKPLPHIFVVIDDFVDFIRNGDNSIVETVKSILINGRQAGVHLIVATSMPSAKVLQKDILSGFPCRICFAVANKADSRLVLGQDSAIGQGSPGEMILKTFSSMQKCHSSYMTEDELIKAAAVIRCKFEKDNSSYTDKPTYRTIKSANPQTNSNSQIQNEEKPDGLYDEYLPQAVETVLEMNACAVSLLQRRMKLGYSRAARLVDQMEALGIIGPYEGAKPRTVLIDQDGWERLKRKIGSNMG